MQHQTYNGWTNYETWNAALWLDNDEGSYSYCRDLTQDAYDQADAINTYLSEVNWFEIAEHYIADADFEEEETETP